MFRSPSSPAGPCVAEQKGFGLDVPGEPTVMDEGTLADNAEECSRKTSRVMPF